MKMCDASGNKERDQQRKVELFAKAFNYTLLWNVHLQLPPPSPSPSPTSSECAGDTCYTRGDVAYFHYGCDGHNDAGWGCAYRTLQSMCSWILQQQRYKYPQALFVPSIREIQETLWRIGDKSPTFVGSRDWIGAMEVCYVVDTRYGVPCKVMHIPRCEDLQKYVHLLKTYFEDFGGFIMMGGDVDAAAKGIAGVHVSGSEAYLLIVDPHLVGIPKSAQDLISRGYIRWQRTSEFVDSSFYNICLPQLKI